MHLIFPKIRRICTLMDRWCSQAHSIQTSETLTNMHGWLIHFLYNHRQTPVFQRDIEKMFSIRRSTVTTILNRMENNRLIVRKSVPEDARLKQIVLTEKAIALHHDVERECQQFEQILTNGISEEEQAQFVRILNTMYQNLEAFEKEGGNQSC